MPSMDHFDRAAGFGTLGIEIPESDLQREQF